MLLKLYSFCFLYSLNDVPASQTHIYLILIFRLSIVSIAEGKVCLCARPSQSFAQARFEGVEWTVFSRFPNGGRHDI